MISKTHTKYIQSLQHKKFRDESGEFIAEGSKTVLELLEGRQFECNELYASKDWLEMNAALPARYQQTAFNDVRDFELENISALSTPNKVLAVFKKKPHHPVIVFKGKVTLLLDTIQDPGNFGTIIRTADWFGVETIICSHTGADMYSPKVVQSTMGSLGRVNIVYDDLGEWIQKNNSIKTYAAALRGKPAGILKGIHEAAIIIGNEAKGINGQLMELVNERITIPGKGSAESLNAAVAAGIILSQV